MYPWIVSCKTSVGDCAKVSAVHFRSLHGDVTSRILPIEISDEDFSLILNLFNGDIAEAVDFFSSCSRAELETSLVMSRMA